tara:strand:+ start:195 stop:521 length:327 start_codon:yes stop_codon:yes gene_type:complete
MVNKGGCLKGRVGEKPNGGCKVGKRGSKMKKDESIKLTVPNKRLGIKKDGTKDKRFKSKNPYKGTSKLLQDMAVLQNRNPGTGKKNRGRKVGSKNEKTRMKELYKNAK